MKKLWKYETGHESGLPCHVRRFIPGQLLTTIHVNIYLFEVKGLALISRTFGFIPHQEE